MTKRRLSVHQHLINKCKAYLNSQQMLTNAQKENIDLLKNEIKQKKVILESYPLSMSVILEGRGCNISCIYCTHWWGEKYKGYTYGTHPHLIKDLKNFFPYLKNLSFGGGEPLMYPEFYEILKMAESHPSLSLSLTTNGISLSRERVKKICSMNFTWLRFSVDAATPESYGKVRQGSRLSKLLQVCEWIQEFRKEQFPKVQWNFVIMDWNYKEIIAFVELAHKFGVHTINFKMLIPSFLANSKFQEIQKTQPPFVSNSELIDLFDLDISSDLNKSKELLGILDEGRRRANKYNIQILDGQVLPYIVKHFPDFSGKKKPFVVSDQSIPKLLNKSNSEIIEYCKEIEKKVPKIEYGIEATEKGKVAYLDSIVKDYFPAFEHIFESSSIISLEEILEKGELLSDMKGNMLSKDIPTEGINLGFFTEDTSFNDVVQDFFCTLPFTNLNWGEGRFQACCYTHTFFMYTRFTDKVQSLWELWNSRAMQEIRRLMYEGKANRTCKRICPHYNKGGVKNPLLI